MLSGPTEVLLEALVHLKGQGIHTQVLNTSHAFHSALLESALEEFEAFATEAPFQLADKTLICNLTGEVLASRQVLDAGYWRRHSREPVQFARSLRTAAELGVGVIVGLGPQPVLLGIAAQEWPEGALVLRPGHSEVRQLAEMMAQLYVQGLTPDFGAWDQPWHRRKLALPTYPFQRRSYYLDHR
jgi:acyl transferase domain-containing protein